MHAVWQVDDESEWDSDVDPGLTAGITEPLAGSGCAPSVTSAQANSVGLNGKPQVKLIVNTILHSMLTFQCESSFLIYHHFFPLDYYWIRKTPALCWSLYS